MLKPHFFFFFLIFPSSLINAVSLNNSHACVSRPVALIAREGQSQVCVHVPPTLVQKILLNTPPDKLNKTIGEAWKKPMKPTLSCSSISSSSSFPSYSISSMFTPITVYLKRFSMLLLSHSSCVRGEICSGGG